MQFTRFEHLISRGIFLVFLSLAMLLAALMPVGAEDSSVFVSIRVYDGVDPADMAEGERITREGFVPIIRQSEGFLAYYVIYTDADALVAINVFETREQAMASNEMAREFVVDHLAPLLPNPPQIVEGSVDIGFVELLDGMGDSTYSSMHASVRIYDEFETDDIDEFVVTVEDGLLPQMRESDGFFGYYLMHDGAGQLAAVSIFDSESSALASNEKARDFVAENLSAFLPNAPSITSGRVGIAVLKAVNDGANLIDDMMDQEQAFVSIRLYDGLDPNDADVLYRLTADEILNVLQQSDGFIGYYWLRSGENVLAINIFATEAQASASNDVARDYVAEHLAGLAPNPPLIVDGPVHLGVVEMLDDMGDGGIDSLYLSLRIYDDFETDDLDEFVTTVQDGFLPLMRESDGFFGYYLMDDGAGALASVSIFDSEASALASNEKARDFVAENLTAFLPSTPSITSGQLDIAALASVNDGANLIDGMMDQGQVFASVRVYDGVDPADQEEIARLVDAGFLPIMRESAGFVGYYLLPAGDRLAAVSFFDTEEQAAASNEKARDFVAESLAPFLPNPPQIVEGLVEVLSVADADEIMIDESMTSLHALLAIYDGFDMARLDETVASVESIFLPALRENGVLFSYYGISDGVDKAVSLRIADSEAGLQQGSDIAADFVAAHLAGWLPENPLQLDGRLGVASVYTILEGANLAEYSRDEASVFASVRVYDGVDPADQEEIARLTGEGFLPIMRASDGFVGYYLLAAGDMLAAVSLFDSAEQASASNDAAREFVVEKLAPLLPNAPMISEGSLSINYIAALPGSGDHGGVGELFASIRFYEGFDLTHFDEANDLAISHLLPALQELGGLFAQLAFNDGENTVVGISIFEGEEAALAANDAGKAFTIEYLADWAPNPPTGVSGEIAIAALAEVDMGANLVGEMMGEG